jgi:hypothetical protein
LAKDFERGGIAIPSAGPGVQLKQIEAIGAEHGEAGGDILAEIVLRVTYFCATVRGGRPDAGRGRGLGGDKHIFFFSGGRPLA